jgi:glycosyltransferase involved in cell wall biosynthesis
MALATSLGTHRLLGTFDEVATYLAVSRFVKHKHIAAGFPEDRIRVKPQFVEQMKPREGPGEYFLYLGRLSQEKGVGTLIEAWDQVRAPLLVVGDGPDARTLRQHASASVRFKAPVSPEQVPEILRFARALLVPSICYEGAPRAILEAYATGVPVVASDIGSLPELVRAEQTGLLTAPGQAGDLAKSVARLLDDRESKRMGQRAYESWKTHYSPEVGLRELESAYREAIGRSQANERDLSRVRSKEIRNGQRT